MINSSKDSGPWKILRVLGSGGFGQVTLWYNSVTGQNIAIKKLHEHMVRDATVKSKVIERWCNEVEIMKKLNHKNIVATLEIPQDLKISSPHSILAMEYCKNGNLRQRKIKISENEGELFQILNKAENCCGLNESDILNILKDISNGLAYLHSCKIIHRDIKPDNIVLQREGLVTIYKLIDLGYAKAFDESSLSKSFVGTILYIAPELFMGKAYTSSVDYWSFGLLTHEIITGYRPFLPGISPSEWMKQIQNKPRNVICVLEDNNGDTMYNSRISRKNHLSRCFLKDMEMWLQLALDWDGQNRGRDLNTKRLVIFEELTKIIGKKMINVFSFPNHLKLSYEINGETDLSDLRGWLKEDTGLEESDQLLLLPNGVPLGEKGNLLRHFEEMMSNRFVINAFLYDFGEIKVKCEEEKRTVFAEEIINSPSHPLSQRELKKSCVDLIYFLQSQAICYESVLQGVKVKINNTKRATLAVESLFEDLEEEWRRIENYGQFLSFSHKTDLENYIYCRKTGKLKSSAFVRKWIQNVINVNNKITELRNSFNPSKQRQLMLIAKQRCRNLDDQSSKDVGEKTPFDNAIKQSYKLWEKIQKPLENDEEIVMFHISRNLIREGVEESYKFLNDQLLKLLFSKIKEADANLAKFVSHLNSILKSAKLLKILIENTQTERQKEVWKLIEGNKELDGSVYEAPESEEDKNAEDLKLLTNKNGLVSGLFFNSNDSTNVSNSLLPDDAPSLIHDNNQLRCRIQEIQQVCHQTIKEITSLNLDFIFNIKENDAFVM